ncbi:hypothetical protein FHS94_000966 [Sphingomonas aerophila]|uniref:Uncharacterized protein n=1 Tax=Sphingomonas aerophila TaxID=1344948 RepID=A0A7W9EV56_9SPHN|nr:hypothetical protein [Sphingomonas aerophila]MBB5714143.1 hypothetical protein [Sphingomonas aerophila]
MERWIVQPLNFAPQIGNEPPGAGTRFRPPEDHAPVAELRRIDFAIGHDVDRVMTGISADPLHGLAKDRLRTLDSLKKADAVIDEQASDSVMAVISSCLEFNVGEGLLAKALGRPAKIDDLVSATDHS